MNLDDKQKEIGKLNFLTVLGSIEGDFLRQAIASPTVGRFCSGMAPSKSRSRRGSSGRATKVVRR